jgi:CheY-like chemotaxis protein
VLGTRLKILLAEDLRSEAEIFELALAKAGHAALVHTVNNGHGVIQYLEGQHEFADRETYPLPDVVITDLKMPGMDGLQLVAWLREHPRFHCLPVVVLTNSGHDSDIEEAYEAGANAYMTKPLAMKQMVEVLRRIIEFWGVCEKRSCCRARKRGRGAHSR